MLRIKKNKNLTIAVGQAWFRAWKDYNGHLKKMGVRTVVVDLWNPGWAQRLEKIKGKVDAYLWHSDTWEENYRRIHDRIFYIANFIKKPVFPDLNMYYSYNDKIKQYEIFKAKKLPMIETYMAIEEGRALGLAEEIKYPIIIKDAYSAGGDGVYKIENKAEFKKTVKQIFSPSGFGKKVGYGGIKNYLYAQKFIPNMKRDLRIITIGGKCACAYWRVGTEWKHNICKGAKLDFNGVPKRAIDFCVKISKENKFHWMSYDLFILPNGKIKLIEWSCNFGVKGPREQGVDVREMQMEYLVKLLTSN
ncbi:MAG: hypothetical protein WC323_00510 [Patescibacteria group bacterium]|jgi:glutathione synthase/RimK-type ligase-like ATP-grasp enzyme